MGKVRVDFDRGIGRLSSYARYHAHANPKSGEVWLGWSVGLWVASLRVKFRAGKLTKAQIQVAEEIGVRFTPPYRDQKPKPQSRAERIKSDYLDRLRSLEGFYKRHGHINVPQVTGTKQWSGAGRWIARIRSLYRCGALPHDVVTEAEKMIINWNPGQGSRSWL